VLKHSQATRVEANLKEEAGKIVLQIHDNGVGIAEEQMSKRKSFGLLGMRERLFHLTDNLNHWEETRRHNIDCIIPISGATTGK